MHDLIPDIIRHHLGDAEFSLLTTEDSGTEPSDAPSSLHCHRYYEIHCNTGHRKRLSLPTGEILLEPEQFLLICPGCMHYSDPFMDRHCVLSFELRQVKGASGFYNHFLELMNGLNLRPLPLNRKFRVAMDAFTSAEPERTVMDFCKRKLLALTVLVALLENLSACSSRRDRTYTPPRYTFWVCF